MPDRCGCQGYLRDCRIRIRSGPALNRRDSRRIPVARIDFRVDRGRTSPFGTQTIPGCLFLFWCSTAAFRLCVFNSNAPEGPSLILRHIRPEFFSSYFVWVFALRFPTVRAFDPYLSVGRLFARLSFIIALALFCLSAIALLILIADPWRTHG